MIHGSIQQYITQVTRQSIRVLRVTLDRYKSEKPIHILSTYAPHNGHTEAERKQQWEEFKEILNKTCKRHMIIWCADANGQLGRETKKKTKEPSRKHNTQQQNRTMRKSKNRKRKRGTTRKNMPRATDDTDDNMGRTEQRKTRHMENTNNKKT